MCDPVNMCINSNASDVAPGNVHAQVRHLGSNTRKAFLHVIEAEVALKNKVMPPYTGFNLGKHLSPLNSMCTSLDSLAIVLLQCQQHEGNMFTCYACI